MSASGGYSASLACDPLGRLFQTSGGSAGTTQLLHDGDALVTEYDGAGTLLRRYVHGPGVDEPVALYEGAGAAFANRAYHLPDERGSIVALVNADGTNRNINSYDAWGIPAATNAGRFAYTGQIRIPEIGMYYYKARIYSPTLGRFLQTDPIGYEDDVNLYACAGNDPVNGRDPSGTAKCGNDERCGQVPKVASSARALIAAARAALKDLRSALKAGNELTADQSALKGAFEAKFGRDSATSSNLRSVSNALGSVFNKIGAEGQGMRIEFGGPNNDRAAEAPKNGNWMRLFDSFFSQADPTRAYMLAHEASHGAGKDDVVSAPGFGRIARDYPQPGINWLAYGRSGSDLGRNAPGQSLNNGDSYMGLVMPADCGE